MSWVYSTKTPSFDVLLPIWQKSLIIFRTGNIYNTISFEGKMLSILLVITCLHSFFQDDDDRCIWTPFISCILYKPMKCLDYVNARPAFVWMCATLYASYGNSIRLYVDSHWALVQCMKAKLQPMHSHCILIHAY